MALLRETNPQRPICRDCHRPTTDDPDAVRCAECNRAQQDRAEDIRRFERDVAQARLDGQARCRHCRGRITSRVRPNFCNDECSNAYRAKDAMAFIEEARRQLDLGAATGILHKLFAYLRDRDGDICYLCDQPVDLDRKGQRGPSVDHVLARTKGGTHDLDNLALTHLTCNVRKGNRDAGREAERIRLS